MYHIGVVLAVVLCAVSNSAENIPPDVEWEQHVQYTISGNQADGYKLSASTTYSQTFLTKRSLDRTQFARSETAGSSISHIRMYANGQKAGEGCTFSRMADDQDVFLTDSKIHYILVPETFEIGDSLSYSFRQEYTDINQLPLTVIRNADRMRQYTVLFKHPADMSVRAESFSPRAPLSWREERVNDKETRFVFDSLEPVAELPGFAFNDIHAVVLFSLYQGDRPVNQTTVAGFVTWYAGKVNLEPTLDSVSWHILDNEIAPASTDLKKLQIIHEWVCREIRYIADMSLSHDFFPHAPAGVLALRYGDCKDRAYLTCALARRYGVQVSMGLVSSQFEPAFHGVHCSLFDHVVCLYRDADSTVCFDPTARFHPFGTLPERIVGHTVLVLDPARPYVDTVRRQDQTADIRISIVASLYSLSTGKAAIELRGDRMAAARSAIAEQTTVPKEQLLSQIIESDLSRISLRRFAIIADSGQSMTLTADADISQFLISSSTNWYIPKTPFLIVVSQITTREQDSLPLHFDSLVFLSLTLRLTAHGIRAEADSCLIGDGDGTQFAAHMQQADDTTLTIDYSAARSNKVFSGAAKSAYLDFCRRYLAARANMFLVKEGVE
jgi:hypothetical protein